MNPEEALAWRPDPLPPVEPELRHPVPRPRALWRSLGTPELEALALAGVAATAWQVDLRRWVTSGAESGPEIRCHYAFLDESGRPVVGRFKGSFDGYHLYVGSPDFARWLDRAFSEGGTFTILHLPGKPKAHRIYGAAETRVGRTLADVVDLLESADPSTRQHLHRQTQEILFKTAKAVDRNTRDREGFYRLVATAAQRRGPGGPQLLDPAAEGICVARCDPETLARLSSLCAQYVPGVWAAR